MIKLLFSKNTKCYYTQLGGSNEKIKDKNLKKHLSMQLKARIKTKRVYY